MAINDLTKQVSTILNAVMTDAYGAKAISKIDVTNLSQVYNYVTNTAITKKIFSNSLYAMFSVKSYAARIYKREHLPIWRDESEFAALCLKTYMSPIEAKDNSVFNVKNGDTAGTFTVAMADIKSAIIELMETWELPLTIPDKALKAAFSSTEDMAAFFQSQYVILDNSFQDTMEKHENMLIAKFMAIKLTTDAEGAHAVNLLSDYNSITGGTLKAAAALRDVDFLEWCAETIENQRALMAKRVKMYNTEEFVRHTPEEYANVFFLKNFDTALTMRLKSNVYHEQLIKLPNFRAVPYWQAPGVKGEFNSVSQISVKDTTTGGTLDVTQTGILALVCDEYAVGATIKDISSPTMVDELKGLTHIANQGIMQHYIDPSENGILYYIEDEPEPPAGG